MVSIRDLVDLVRAPAALSVPGDAIAGAAAAGGLGRRTAALAAASVCLYWAGMAANDWADRDLDAVERPERPIPSGRVTAGTAVGIAAGLTAAAVATAAMSGGRRALAIAAPLAAAVWAYDAKLKNTAAGPAGMAICRGLDVLLGASGGRIRRALAPAAVVATHTYALTALSRREVTGADTRLSAATMTATAAVATAASVPHTARTPLLPGLLAAGYALRFGRAQHAVRQDPSPERVRAAVASGITALPTLQAALTAAHGSPAAAVLLTGAAPLGRRLARVVSPT